MNSPATSTREATRVAAHPRHTPIPFVAATPSRLRFDIEPRHHVSFFADRLRLSPYTDLGHLFVGIGADVGELHPCFSPVEVNLPVKDRRAYERACAAFNSVMDEHQAREDQRNERRRERRARA